MGASFIQGSKVKQLKSKLDLNGAATLDGSAVSANTVVIADASKNIKSSDISTTELSYLDNVSANIQTQLDGKLDETGGTVSGALTVTGAILTQTSIQLEDPGAGTNKIVLQAPTLSQDNTYTLPTDYPAATGYVLSSTTAGAMSWVAQSGGSTPTASTASLSNNQTSYANIAGLILDGAANRSAHVEYHIYRTTDAATAFEKGAIDLMYNGSTWYIARQYSNDAGLDLDITTSGVSGQVQYKSSNMAGASYNGKITFLTESLPV